jgi:hypothetical protein
VLAAATRTIAALRPARKPLHPDGEILRGRVHRQGSRTGAGVPWLDEVGQDDVIVRMSRAIGLPEALPDIHGLALRVLSDEGPADLLLASTGWGRLSRFVLTFGQRPESRPLTSLLPYRTESGPVVLGARALTPSSYALSWSRADGDWHLFATLQLSGELVEDEEVSFDPVVNQLPGLGQYPVVVRLREPSYLIARRSRR